MPWWADLGAVVASKHNSPFSHFFNTVAGGVSDGSFELDLAEGTCFKRCGGLCRLFCGGRGGGGRSVIGDVFGEGRTGGFAELLDKFEGEGAAGAFVAVDRRGHEDEVGTDEVPYEG